MISSDGVNLRASPSGTASILQVLPFDAVVTVTGVSTADGWYPVTAGGQTGWISGAYLAAGALDAGAAAVATAMTPATTAPAAMAPSATLHGAASSSSAGSAPSLLTASASPQSETLTASYYGIDDGTVAGTMMACGAPFDPFNVHDASTNDFSCGTKLLVTAPDGRQLDVVVTDHGAYRQHWMDLTYAAFGMLADHRQGVIQVSVKVEP